jgi:NADH-quinone oxidoreductase subunit J
MSIAFYIFAAIAVVCSLLMIVKRNVLISALSLLGVLVSTACIFILLNAHLIAFFQIILYAGAIIVLFVITINIIPLKEEVISVFKMSFIKITAVPLCIFLIWQLIAIGRTLINTPFSSALKAGTVEMLSDAIFKNYVLQFELMSVLLLAGIVGAIIIAKRRI